jgi:NADH-quinone oxidoreductase subunit F
MRIESRAGFEALREEARRRAAGRSQQILVCCGTGCLASGSKGVAEAFTAEVAKRGLDVSVGTFVKTTGCHGF